MSRTIHHHPSLHVHFLALLLVGLSLPALADFATGVRNSAGAHRLNAAQLQQVQASLRHKSGFVELGFDEAGALTLGQRQHIQGGSATARALLIAAVDGAHRYELESHERSPEIAFARLSEGEIHEIAGQRREIYQVRLDFADFYWLSGAPEAKASFDVGVNVLHELTHGVLQLQDPKGAMDQIGACDAHVNQMRRELGLPERLYYHPDIRVMKTANGAGVVRALLEFVERKDRNTRPSATYQLFYLASKVSPNAMNVTALEKGLVGVKLR